MSSNDFRIPGSKEGEDDLTIHLTINEAVVLLGFTQRYTQTNQLTIEDQAEQRALWNLCCILEREDEHWWPSFEKARAELRDPPELWDPIED